MTGGAAQTTGVAKRLQRMSPEAGVPAAMKDCETGYPRCRKTC